MKDVCHHILSEVCFGNQENCVRANHLSEMFNRSDNKNRNSIGKPLSACRENPGFMTKQTAFLDS